SVPNAGTAAVTGVTYSYQWQNSSGTNISGATSSTYKITKPTYTTGTTYKVVVTATPKDNRTAAKSSTYTVTLKVNKKGVTKPSAVTGLVYDGTTKTGVSSANTALYTVTSGTGTNAGSYTAKAKLVDTTNYCWGSDGGTTTGEQSIAWSIAKATVAVPTVTTGTFTYNASAQQPTLSYNTTLCNYTAEPKTNAGSYTVNVTLKNTTNYKWATTPSGGTESGAYPLTWKINKANITLTAPSYTTTVSNNANSTVYVGLNLGQLTLTQSSGTHVRAGSSANVEGEWSWSDAASTAITATTTGKTAKYTPTDKTNYNEATITVDIAPQQLYVQVYEVRLQFYYYNQDGSVHEVNVATATVSETRKIIGANRILSATPVRIPVNYGSNFTIANLKNASVNGVNMEWQKPAGYEMNFYRGVTASNTGSDRYTVTSLDNITVNQTIYIAYVAQEVNYTVYQVFESLHPDVADGHTPLPADVLTLTADQLEEYGVKKTVKKIAAGSLVSFPTEPVEGFTRALDLKTVTNGREGCISDDQNKFVLGTGNTVLITYYSRNTYRITWNYAGGSIDTFGNKKQITMYYGQQIANPGIPTYPNSEYTFSAWFSDSACTQLANVIGTEMPANALNLYAGRNSKSFTISYNYNFELLAEQLNEKLNLSSGTGITVSYLQRFYEVSPAVTELGPTEYTVDQVISNSMIRLTTPSMLGFTFKGWYYYPGGDINATPVKLGNITRSTVGDYNLFAQWETKTFTVTLDSNGGNRLSQSLRLDNFSLFPDTVLEGNNQIVPVRAGYEFTGWAFKNDADETGFTEIMDGDWYNRAQHEAKLYATWKEVPVSIVYTDDADVGLLDYDSVQIKIGEDANARWYTLDEIENLDDDEQLTVGKVITMRVTPIDGYDVDYITLGGVSFTNGGRYSIRTYTNNELKLNIKLRARTYTITYIWNGGTTPETNYVNTYSIEDNYIDIIGGKLIDRNGYTFVGWSVDANGENGTINDGQQDKYRLDNPFDEFEGRSVILYAQWAAAPVKMVYSNNFITNGISERVVELSGRDVNEVEIVTGSEITLYVPEASFIPANREIIGWAESPEGTVKYNVNYKYENGEFVAQPVKYTVRAAEKDANGNYIDRLYAIWRVTNVQYLTFDAQGNNSTYGSGSFTGVDVTARPRYAYEKEASLQLTFYWYKVDTNSSAWHVWTQEEIEAEFTGDALTQAQTYVGMYRIPESATFAYRSQVTGAVDDVSQMSKLSVANVSESGLYICRLDARGTAYSSTGTLLGDSTATMYGQYQVIINQATLPVPEFTAPDTNPVYDGTNKTQTIVAPATWTAIDGTPNAYRLPDDSAIEVTYTYTNLDTNQRVVNTGVSAAGEYSVKAVYSFIKDATFKDNYVLPDEKIIGFEIDQREITNVTYSIEKYVDGAWQPIGSAEASFADNVYSRNPIRIVAVSSQIAQGDDATIVMYYDGDITGDNFTAPTNVGNYVACCDSISGDESANYTLSSNLPSRAFNIIKATHNIEIVFEDASATFDGETHTLKISKVIDKVSGAELEIQRMSNAQDRFVIASDECMITVSYDVSYEAVDNDYAGATAGQVRCGGIHAGVYTVTASFMDTTANQVNFEVLDDMEAVLTIQQAVYSADGTNPGLTDAQLNKYEADGETLNVNGFGSNHTVARGTRVAPKLNLDSNFKVVYKYEYQRTGAASFEDEKYLYDSTSANGLVEQLTEPGRYRITAEISYLNGHQYSNDYITLGDQVIEVMILPGDLKGLKAVYTQDARYDVYKYGDTFDFMDLNGGYNYEYANGDSVDVNDNRAGKYTVKIIAEYEVVNSGVTSTVYEILENSNCLFTNEDGTEFTTFNKATRAPRTGSGSSYAFGALIDSADYKIKVTYYGQSCEFEIKVEQTTLNSNAISFDSDNVEVGDLVNNGSRWSYTFNYDGKAHRPELAGADLAYNIVGINASDLKAGDIT
ncbi:MAG: InlB B-repeat-containing protein, partial [Firmicutes bacterium]|nr:InlB B-repeat-containing protein [Bacillota bacterium]